MSHIKIEDACKTVGVSRRKLRDRMRDEGFQKLVQERVDQAALLACGQLRELAVRANATAAELLEHENPSVGIRALRTIYEHVGLLARYAGGNAGATPGQTNNILALVQQVVHHHGPRLKSIAMDGQIVEIDHDTQTQDAD